MSRWEKTWVENDLRRAIEREDDRKRFEEEQRRIEIAACRKLGILHSSEL